MSENIIYYVLFKNIYIKLQIMTSLNWKFDKAAQKKNSFFFLFEKFSINTWGIILSNLVPWLYKNNK